MATADCVHAATASRPKWGVPGLPLRGVIVVFDTVIFPHPTRAVDGSGRLNSLTTAWKRLAMFRPSS
jgi:hypothetical protein